jgi:hypothetical protein
MPAVAKTRVSAKLIARPIGAPQPVEIEVLAREAGLHPDLVRRFVALGLLEPADGIGRPLGARAARPAARGAGRRASGEAARPTAGPAGRAPARAPLFPRDAAAVLARAARLRRDLGLNYAGAVMASQLLARIDELEERLRRYEP